MRQLILLAGSRRHPELILTLGVGGILAMMIVPLPPGVLDVLLATNMALAALILIAVLLSEKPLAVSSFPTLLLITTLFRLGLNVSTTRMILGEGSAGDVVTAFGEFVARGDVVMGLVVFLVLTLVQLLVIGKGAERVAEVGARFTLDAMPGKQMSIDAGLRNGALTEAEAEERRGELGRESQFYGAMDGAMKFVKGDATVGLVVTVLNLLAGLAIGVFRFDLSLAEAAETFAILTIGDGLVSQIPSLLIALASGILTTRVASKNPSEDLGQTLSVELFANPKVLGLSAAFALVVGLIPGLPVVPFLVIAGLLGGGALLLRNQWHIGSASTSSSQSSVESLERSLEDRKKMAQAQKAVSDQLAPTVPLLGIDLEASLSEALGFGEGRDDATELMSEWMAQARDAIYSESGVRMPGVRVKSFVPGLGPSTLVFRVKDVPVAVERVDPRRPMALASAASLKRIGVEAEPCPNPLSSAPACLIDPELESAVVGAGIQALSPAGVVALHLVRIARAHLDELVGLQDTAENVKRLQKVCPDLVQELIPKVVTVAQLRDVLRQLVRERISIRDLRSILEAVGELGEVSRDLVALTEHVRSRLSLQLTHQWAGPDLRLGVVVLAPEIEDLVRDAIVQTPRGTHLAMEPEVRQELTAAVQRTFKPIRRANVQGVLITQSDIRYFVRLLLDGDLGTVPVVSYEELRSDVVLQPLGQVRMERAASLLAA